MWVVDNLLAEVAPADIIAELVASRVPEAIARAEVLAIMNSPSLVACRHLHVRVGRLQQLARLQRSLASQATAAESEAAATPDGERSPRTDVEFIERREHIPADEFFRHYFAGNRPVILTGHARTWPAFGKWTPAYFKDAFGAEEIEIVAGRARDPDGDRNYEKYRQKTTMSEYVDRVLAAGASNDIYMIARNKNMTRDALLPLLADVVFDEHLFDLEQVDGGTTLWFGPAGTVTPLHHDSTNILFCQIYGRKRVVLISPFQTELLFSARGFYSAYNLEDPDALTSLRAADIAVHEIDLAPGEALFIPAGWWHHVKALSVSITFSLLNFRRPNDYSFYRPGSLQP